MEYERIEKKSQGGMLSPSKLRMKLMGPHHNRNKKEGSNSNSSRTSPSKLDVSHYVTDTLLSPSSSHINDEVEEDSRQHFELSNEQMPDKTLAHHDTARFKTQQFSKNMDTCNLSAVHPMRTLEDDNLDYDSNASSSSFEFHKGERSSSHSLMGRQFPRPMSSKWNDAEKWIMSRQNLQQNHSKKNVLSNNQANRMTGRVAPDAANNEHNKPMTSRAFPDTKRVDFCQPAAQIGAEKFSFVGVGVQSFAGQDYKRNTLADQSTQCKDLGEADHSEVLGISGSVGDAPAGPTVRSVCMRDMGTEMTPGTSLEPSRSTTPVGATTPLSSLPSTPRGPAPASTPTYPTSATDTSTRKELSEQEQKLKTRREIIALGVQLGKTNIAAWASKEDHQKNASSTKTSCEEELEQIEFEKRAAAWEEAEKTKQAARFKSEESKIEAWESYRKAKLEAEMRKMEAKVERIRVQAEAMTNKKIVIARQRSEKKRAAAEARKKQDEQKTAAQTEYIRQTGRLPPSSNYICCGLLS